MTAPGERTDPAPTDEQIAEWVALADAATPEPWTSHARIVGAGPDAVLPVAAAMRVNVRSINNAEFIAAARTAVPALAAALSSARAENAALHESLNVTDERAAGDRRALDEARAKLAAEGDALAALGQFRNWLRSAVWQSAKPTVVVDVLDNALAHFDVTPEQCADALAAALAAAQPTESAPR